MVTSPRTALDSWSGKLGSSCAIGVRVRDASGPSRRGSADAVAMFPATRLRDVVVLFGARNHQFETEAAAVSWSGVIGRASWYLLQEEAPESSGGLISRKSSSKRRDGVLVCSWLGSCFQSRRVVRGMKAPALARAKLLKMDDGSLATRASLLHGSLPSPAASSFLAEQGRR